MSHRRPTNSERRVKLAVLEALVRRAILTAAGSP